MSDKPAIGFIGVGLMGHGMAKNLLEKGYALTIKGNRNRAPVEDLLARGATEVASPREVAEASGIVHLCLSNSPQVEAVIHGPDGILQAARPGLIVLDCSTSNPVSTLKLAEELAAKGATLVDAPLGRTPAEAEAGTLDAMLGCDEETFARILPVVECWAGAVTRIGPVGSGHRMKLLMNFLSMSYGALYSELVSLGAAVGIAPATIRSVIGPGRMGCGFFETYMRYVVDGDHQAHKFTITNACKDVDYINAMAADAGVVNIMASAMRHYYAHAAATGHGDDFLPSLSERVAELNGIDLAKPTGR